MDAQSPPKWQGLITAKFPSIQPDKAWSLVGEYCSLHKLLPSIPTCRKVEGTDGVLGCFRYCATGPDPTGSVHWANEKLVAIDQSKRSYSYVITENNLDFVEYFATSRVVECNDGSMLEWEFECEPVVGTTQSWLVEFLEGCAKEIAKSVVDELGGNK